jgi:hypothetical protein
VANAGGGNGSDIGAYELRPSVRMVTTLADAGAGSLRQAITDMHPYDADSVKFAPNVKGTITLTSGVLTFAKSGVLAGPGAWTLAVSGNNANRIFAISSGKSVEISGLTVTGGKETEGVAILSNGALTRAPAASWEQPPTGDVASAASSVKTWHLAGHETAHWRAA